MQADFVITDATIVTCAGSVPRCGPEQRVLDVIDGGTIASHAGQIVHLGPTAAVLRDVDLTTDATSVSAAGATIVPGFVDPHTHAVFAGDRRDELRRRLAGESYAAIARQGGGIVSTVEATRAASEDQLVAQTRPRLAEMLACGTTTAEVKSGYGLDTDAELRMLRAIRHLDGAQPVDLVPTFLGAHEIPLEYRDRRRDFIDLVTQEMIPAVAAEGLAEWCDVFCEQGVYDPNESLEILTAGLRAGLRPRIHADELAASGGAMVAAQLGARSADHLIFANDESIPALRSAGVVATLLPVAAFYLKLGRFAPARRLIDAGVPVALATDVNPGGGFSPSMPFAMALACFGMDMTLEEALVASTINAAYSVDRQATVGSLEVGKQMDLVMVQGPLVDLLRVGAPAIGLVVKRGRVVVDRREGSSNA